MGYTHGIKWSEDKIKNGIMVVVNELELGRMPSRVEIEDYYGNSALTNKIARYGGFETWAKKLGLQRKNSESGLGIRFERIICDVLEKKGFQCGLTSVKAPYDILVNGKVKIDVKVARKSKVRSSDVYSFRLAKPMQTCDVYIAVCLGESDDVQKTYIIPSNILTGKTQLCVGINKSKYDKYLEKWEIISKIDAFLKKL